MIDMQQTIGKVLNSSSISRNEGLRKYMLGIYNYMTVGIMLTAVISYALAKTGLVYYIARGPLSFVFLFAPIAISLFLAARLSNMSVNTAKLCFFLYAASLGCSLSTIFIVFNPMDIARSFFITSSVFASMSIYGYVTKKDLSEFSSYVFMFLIGLMISSVVNIFLQSSMFSFIISLISVAVFTFLVAYDTQKIKSIYYQSGNLPREFAVKLSIIGALSLYIDFIALFVNILRIMSAGRSDK